MVKYQDKVEIYLLFSNKKLNGRIEDKIDKDVSLLPFCASSSLSVLYLSSNLLMTLEAHWPFSRVLIKPQMSLVIFFFLICDFFLFEVAHRFWHPSATLLLRRRRRRHKTSRARFLSKPTCCSSGRMCLISGCNCSR